MHWALAGVVQALLGSRIPTWTGGKAWSGWFGLLTIAMSAVAAVGALTFERPASRGGVRLAATAIVSVIGVAGFASVAWLWLLPGPLMLAGAAFSVARTQAR